MARSASGARPTRVGSAFEVVTETGDDAGGGLTRRERNDMNATAPRTYLRGHHDGFLAVVATLHQHIGTQLHDQLEGCVLLEHDHAIDRLERGDDIGALGLTAHGTRRTLEATYRSIAVDRHDEVIAGAAGAGNDVHVARMNQVEDAVGEDDTARLRRTPALRIGPTP